MTRTRAFEVIDAGIATISFSIETLNKEIYEKIRVGLDLDEVITNVLSFIELRDRLNPGIPIKIVFIAHTDNRETIGDYAQFCLKHLSPHDTLVTVPQHNFANAFQSEVSAGTRLCGFPFTSINILYDGMVNLCCVDTEVQHPLGNVNENTILEIFNGERYREIRAAHSSSRRNSVSLCASCNVPEALLGEKSFMIARHGETKGLRPLN